VPKRTLLGTSALLASGGVSGWGLYMGMPCKKFDYIGEYVGEIISRNEAEERGTIYDRMNLNYLFDLNKCKWSYAAAWHFPFFSPAK
jgi:histone-lysine N-methyltransferase EZH2